MIMFRKQLLIGLVVVIFGVGFELFRSKVEQSGANLAGKRNGPIAYVEDGRDVLAELKPVSFQGALAQQTVDISVDTGTTPPPGGSTCSVGSLACSVQQGTPSSGAQCSVNHSEGTSNCSTSNPGAGNNHGTCSASVNPGQSPVDPVICSAVPAPGGVTSCSVAANDPDTRSCSTYGGQQAGAGGGNSACSAGLTGTIPGNQTTSCSVRGTPVGGGGAPSCSTYSNPLPENPNNPDGHQVCSAGRTGGGETATCSVTATIEATCSVNESPENPTMPGNKCSVSHGDPTNPATGNPHCSISGNNTNPQASCSVMSNQTNVQCTVLAGNIPDNQCSVQAGSQGFCSIMGEEKVSGLFVWWIS